MVWLSCLLLITISLVSTVHANIVEERHSVIRTSDFTFEPANGSTIVPGSTFPFAYQPGDGCHGCFSPISVYLSVVPPSADNITSTGGLNDGSYIAFFGDYDIPNCGGLPRPFVSILRL